MDELNGIVDRPMILAKRPRIFLLRLVLPNLAHHPCDRDFDPFFLYRSKLPYSTLNS